MTLSYSEVESSRFKLNIYRGNIDRVDTGKLKKILAAPSVDVLIFRIPTKQVQSLFLLNELERSYIVADTLVYYEQNLKNFIPKENVTSTVEHEIFSDKDKNVIEDIVKETFKNYSNHYKSNPLLGNRNIIEGYMEWATTYINLPNSYSLLLKVESQYVGFITTRMNNEKEAEIVLNGVLPGYEGKGIYRYALNEVRKYYKSQSVEKICISTQIQNDRVQNIWISEGFYVKSSFYTIHVNNI